MMRYVVRAELPREDREGRGATLGEAVKTVGPLRSGRGVISVYIRRSGGSGGVVEAEGENMVDALVRFIEAIEKEEAS